MKHFDTALLTQLWIVQNQAVWLMCSFFFFLFFFCAEQCSKEPFFLTEVVERHQSSTRNCFLQLSSFFVRNSVPKDAVSGRCHMCWILLKIKIKKKAVLQFQKKLLWRVQSRRVFRKELSLADAIYVLQNSVLKRTCLWTMQCSA